MLLYSARRYCYFPMPWLITVSLFSQTMWLEVGRFISLKSCTLYFYVSITDCVSPLWLWSMNLLPPQFTIYETTYFCPVILGPVRNRSLRKHVGPLQILKLMFRSTLENSWGSASWQLASWKYYAAFPKVLAVMQHLYRGERRSQNVLYTYLGSTIALK